MNYNILSPNIIECEDFLPQHKIDLLYVDFLNNRSKFSISSWRNEDGSSSPQFYNSSCGGFDFWNWEGFEKDCPAISSMVEWFLHQGLGYFSERNNLQLFTLLKQKVWYDTHVVGYNHGGYYNWHTDAGKGNVFTFNLVLNKSKELEGGDMLFMDGKELIKVKNKNNYMVVFPSFIPHAITPLYTQNKKDVSFTSQRFSVQFWIKLSKDG
jgi:Rps23 Pro-64 3,4-dihydroxylase Tpa1-like proline 4-hydroxylase